MPNAAPTPTYDSLPVLRAAYSDRTAALMAALADFAYQPVPAEDPIARTAEIARLPEAPSEAPEALKALGLHTITHFHNGLTDGWAYVAEGPAFIVLAFRGTKSIKNWGTNFQAALVHPGHGPAELRVHRGFYAAFGKLAAGRHSLREKMRQVFAAGQASPRPVYITGHSLGGALAQIASAVFGCDQVAACYTYGSPRVGNRYFDLWVKVPSYRVVNAADIVPTVPPPLVYRHSGDPRYLSPGIRATEYRYAPGPILDALHYLQGLAQFATTFQILGIADHMLDGYRRKLNAIAGVRRQSR